MNGGAQDPKSFGVLAAPGQNPMAGMMPQGLGNLIGGRPQPMPMPMGKAGIPMKEDNGSPQPDIVGTGGGMPTNSVPPGGTAPGGSTPTAPGIAPAQPNYSAASYNQPFAPFPNFNAQAQAAFQPLPQTNVSQYGRWNQLSWPGIGGNWPQLYGGIQPGVAGSHTNQQTPYGGMGATPQISSGLQQLMNQILSRGH